MVEHVNTPTEDVPPVLTTQQLIALNLRASGHDVQQTAALMRVKPTTVKEHYYRGLHKLAPVKTGETVDAAYAIFKAFDYGILKTQRERDLEKRLAFLESGSQDAIEPATTLKPGASPIERINQVAYRLGRLSNLPAHPAVKAELNRLAHILSDCAEQVTVAPNFTGHPVDDARTALTLAARYDAGIAAVAEIIDRDHLSLVLDGHPEISQTADVFGWDSTETTSLLVTWIVRDVLGINQNRYEDLATNNSAALVRMFEIAYEEWK